MTPKLLLVFWCMLGINEGWAQKVCDPQDPRLCSQPMRQGDVTPFTGQLLTPELAIRLGQRAEYCDVRTKAEVDLATKLGAIDLGLERRLRQADGEAYSAQVQLWQKELQRAKEVPVWERPWAVAVATATITLALAALAVKGAALLR